MKATTENLIKAEECIASAVAELKEAYFKSEPLVEIMVISLLEDAVEIERRLNHLNKALRAR